MCVDGWPVGRHVQLNELGRARFPGRSGNIYQIVSVKHRSPIHFICLHRVLPTRAGGYEQWSPVFFEFLPLVVGRLSGPEPESAKDRVRRWVFGG